MSKKVNPFIQKFIEEKKRSIEQRNANEKTRKDYTSHIFINYQSEDGTVKQITFAKVSHENNSIDIAEDEFVDFSVHLLVYTAEGMEQLYVGRGRSRWEGSRAMKPMILGDVSPEGREIIRKAGLKHIKYINKGYYRYDARIQQKWSSMLDKLQGKNL